jgi:small GTP-binding protein
MDYNDDINVNYKIVFIGDSNVGKTNIINKMMDHPSCTKNNENVKSTIGVDFVTRVINIDNNLIKMQIWDTAGQEKYRFVTNSYYRGARLIVLVYDITNTDSFKNLDKWIKEVNQHVKNHKIILIGNKIDTNIRAIGKTDGLIFAADNNCEYIETSALSGEKIMDVYEQIIKYITEDIINNIDNNDYCTDDIIMLTNKKVRKQKICCGN